MPQWNSEQYLKFKTERTQPAIDLAARIARSGPLSVLDVGCGPGNSTAVLRERFPQAQILGIDSSENMVQAAKESCPDCDFLLCAVPDGLAAWKRRFDVIFSNACLQWVPNHKQLIPQLMDCLKPGGLLAVQTPMNYEEPIHQIIGRISVSERWKSRFLNPRIFYNLRQEAYFNLLSGCASDFTLWQTTYFHRLSSHEAILDWYRGTGLRPYLEVLSEAEKKEFESDILKELVPAYPVQENGQIIFRFPRFFFLAER